MRPLYIILLRRTAKFPVFHNATSNLLSLCPLSNIADNWTVQLDVTSPWKDFNMLCYSNLMVSFLLASAYTDERHRLCSFQIIIGFLTYGMLFTAALSDFELFYNFSSISNLNACKLFQLAPSEKISDSWGVFFLVYFSYFGYKFTYDS